MRLKQEHSSITWMRRMWFWFLLKVMSAFSAWRIAGTFIRRSTTSCCGKRYFWFVVVLCSSSYLNWRMETILSSTRSLEPKAMSRLLSTSSSAMVIVSLFITTSLKTWYVPLISFYSPIGWLDYLGHSYWTLSWLGGRVDQKELRHIPAQQSQSQCPGHVLRAQVRAHPLCSHKLLS